MPDRRFQLIRWICLFVLLCSAPLYAQEDPTRELIVSGVEQLREGNYEASLSTLTRALNAAREEGDDVNTFLAYNNIGLNYFQLLDYSEALENYLSAYTLAITALDPKYEMIVLNNIGIVYSTDEKFEKSAEYFGKAYELARNENDSLKIGIYALNIGQSYLDQDRMKDAVPLIEESVSYLVNYPDYRIQAEALEVQVLYENGELEQARRLADELLPQFEENRFQDSRISLNLVLAGIDAQQGDLDAAILRMTDLLNTPATLENRVGVYQKLATYRMQNDQYALALQAKDSVLMLKDELAKAKSNKKYEGNRVRLEIRKLEHELSEERSRTIFQRRLLMVIGISAFISIVLLIWSLRLSRVRSRQKRVLLERSERINRLELDNQRANNLLLEEQLKEQEARALLEQEQLQREIESKNRKLSAKALYQTDRNQLITSIIDDLESSQKITPSAEVGQHIRKLRELLRTDQEWETFVQHFDEVNSGFITRLKQGHPELNANDIRFISYLFMNLSMKEIASILNITPEACRKRKERISKKLGLTEKTELYSYLSQI